MLHKMITSDEYQDFSDTIIHGKLHDISAPHDEETALQGVSVAENIQGKKARLQDCENIYKGYVGPLICSPSLAKSVSKPTSVDNENNTLMGNTPVCRVKNIKVDMREPENNYNLTRMEYRKDTEQYIIDRVSLCVAHRSGDKHIRFPKNTSY